MSAHGRGYHVSRDPSCYGCGDPAQWTGHWCDQCKTPVKMPWDTTAGPIVMEPRGTERKTAPEPMPTWLEPPF